MDKIKIYFENNRKTTWSILVGLLVITLFIGGLQLYKYEQVKRGCDNDVNFNRYTGKLCSGKTEPPPCASGELYNRDTGKICPESPEPHFDPKLLDKTKG